MRRAGLLDEASVEPDKHISMHPALRVSILASGNFAALSRAGEARFTGCAGHLEGLEIGSALMTTTIRCIAKYTMLIMFSGDATQDYGSLSQFS